MTDSPGLEFINCEVNMDFKDDARPTRYTQHLARYVIIGQVWC